jgi:hypothetical protein
MSPRPLIRKLGTIDCDLVETTPLVFRDRLYRYEYVREGYAPNTTGASYSRFVDVAAGQYSPPFAAGYHLGSAFAEGDYAYVFAVDIWDGEEIRVFRSTDLQSWESREALRLPGWGLFNSSVCRGPDGYVMAFEVGRAPHDVGVRFTNYFARSDDLLHWELLPLDRVFALDRYTACPALRYLSDGRYYMLYLEALPGPSYEMWLTRTADLVNWELSPLNPVLAHDADDKLIANPALGPAERACIERAENRNSSDVDLCEWQGKVVLNYSWGNQQGNEFLAEAVYDGTLEELLQGFFP